MPNAGRTGGWGALPASAAGPGEPPGSPPALLLWRPCGRGRPRLESGGRYCASASGAASTCDLQGKPQHGAMEITWASRRTGAASWDTAAESIWGHLSVGLVHFCPSRSPCDVAWPKAHSAARYRRVKAFFSQREGHKSRKRGISLTCSLFVRLPWVPAIKRSLRYHFLFRGAAVSSPAASRATSASAPLLVR